MAGKRPYDLPAGTRLELRSPRGGATSCVVLSPLDHGANSQSHLARTADGQHVVLKASRWIEPGRIAADLRIEEEILRHVPSEALIRLLGSAEGPGGKLVLAYERAFTNPLLILSRPEVRRHFPDPGTTFVPLPPAVTLRLACDLLRGIGQMHAQGFVHHDIKVSNLMVRVPELGEVVPDHKVLAHALAGRARGVLIDVGGSRSVAYLEELNAGRVSADLDVVPPQLTPLYAPPEALVGRPDRTGARRRVLLPALDLYAAGLVLYSSATGRAPYEGHAVAPDSWDDLLELKEAELLGKLKVAQLAALRASPGYQVIAGELLVVIEALLDPEPDRRPRAREARLHLERLLASLPAV